MYYRRTFSCSTDVIPAGTANSATPWYRRLWLAVAMITLLMLTGSGLVAQPVSIEIEPARSVDLGSIATINVTVGSAPSWFDMGGFDLLLAYDTLVLEVVSVSQGGLLDSCGWEYFESRIGSETDCGGQSCPNGLIRLVGVADLAAIPGSPTCNADSTGTLARIEFQVSSDSAYECWSPLIRFMWYDCGDNSLSSISGDSLFISQAVYDEWGGIHAGDTTFPTPWGAPDTCLANNSTVLRRVEYHHGYVDIMCAPEPPDPGDVNLNGIGFEIADLVLFENYFWLGLFVFNINIEGQIRASEVNGDGVPLTLQDLVYMYSYIYDGPDVPHHPPDPGDTVFFSQDTVGKSVSLSYSDSLNAVLMIFDGVLDPWGEDSLGFDGQYTRVLLNTFYSWGDSTIFEQDSLFFYTGEGTLVAAYAAADGYTPIPTAIVGGAGDCCLHKGNVDNDPSGEVNIADLVYLVDYMFEDGPEPPCMRQADVIEDWSIDIADLVFLVDYMFNGGPAALPCP